MANGIYAKLMNDNTLMNRQIHVPTRSAVESTTSGSFVFVALTPVLDCGKSPVMKEPDPANVFVVLVGLSTRESPIWTIELGPTVKIFMFPTMDGIGNILFKVK